MNPPITERMPISYQNSLNPDPLLKIRLGHVAIDLRGEKFSWGISKDSLVWQLNCEFGRIIKELNHRNVCGGWCSDLHCSLSY